ncbi:MAG: hypothetical protein HN704_00820 [Bacteroidetes bacterium]|jgi:hypothetical protein|nr:hypothetical protein [Bacteroidota bacterium]MBT6687392.1 hypothetical protein [Bacteroidota bacterium]MBT7142604.1 hypothetical protein [Bacteroidota bacterium]MBT7490127.1 hypothetical protein [Bacteroidota bacterium]
MEVLNLPEIITLEEFEGNFPSFYEAVYDIFKSDFVNTKPIYKGKQLRLKAHPYIEGKEYTFYHFTHEGNIECDRKPNLRRMERIAFPRPMIDNSEHSELKVWRNKRRNKERILILHEEEKYIVVLEDRKNYILPWTAYYIEHNNKIRRLIKEYELYIKTETA